MLVFDDALRERTVAPTLSEMVASRLDCDRVANMEEKEAFDEFGERLHQLREALEHADEFSEFIRALEDRQGDIVDLCRQLSTDPGGGLAKLAVLVLRVALKVYMKHHGIESALEDIAMEGAPAEIKVLDDVLHIEHISITHQDLQDALTRIREPKVEPTINWP
jgi:hypothetical protein